MPTATAFTPAERLESLKAAALGSLGAGIAALLLAIAHGATQPGLWPPMSIRLTSLVGFSLVVSSAIAAFSGALFALTYRYAIRQDPNPQLKAGAVLAFALVRGLAQVDVGSAIAQHYWPFGVACGESLLLFGSSAIVLNLALQQSWLKPFGPTAPPT